MHPRFLSDRFRLIRSSLVGIVSTLILIQLVTLKEAFTISITMALVWDLLTLYHKTWKLSMHETRQVFARWQSVESYVALRTVALVFMSVGLLCFCIRVRPAHAMVRPGELGCRRSLPIEKRQRAGYEPAPSCRLSVSE